MSCTCMILHQHVLVEQVSWGDIGDPTHRGITQDLLCVYMCTTMASYGQYVLVDGSRGNCLDVFACQLSLRAKMFFVY